MEWFGQGPVTRGTHGGSELVHLNFRRENACGCHETVPQRSAAGSIADWWPWQCLTAVPGAAGSSDGVWLTHSDRLVSDRWLWPPLLGKLSLDVSPKTTTSVPLERSCLTTKPTHREGQSRKMERTWVPNDAPSCWVNRPRVPPPTGLLYL
uniref:Uncharacterized protein n=1 Tax=Myotis myotis TaxID=51298 RepID=A0A7J7Z6T5_MYOMY|nr:hypothetical protein mMyoMyo1_010749 [Myotis myotis]